MLFLQPSEVSEGFRVEIPDKAAVNMLRAMIEQRPEGVSDVARLHTGTLGYNQPFRIGRGAMPGAEPVSHRAALGFFPGLNGGRTGRSRNQRVTVPQPQL